MTSRERGLEGARRRSRMAWTRWVGGALAGVVALVALATTPAVEAATEYRLGPGDVVRLAVYARADLSGTYGVQDTGDLSVPLVGALQVGGLTLRELEHAVAGALERALGEKLSVTAETTTRRPYYIDGDVAQPGAYPHRPDLSFAKALAIAGGRFSERRAGASVAGSSAREQERIDLLLDGYRVDIATEARLLAERDQLAAIAFPASLTSRAGDRRVAEILDAERRLFEARRTSREAQLAALTDQRTTTEEEIAVLKLQRKALDDRRRIVEKQFKDMKSLIDRGAVPRATALQVEISIAGIESEARGIELSAVRANQQLNQIDKSVERLRSDWAGEIATALRAVRQQIERTRIRLEMTGARMAELDEALEAVAQGDGVAPGKPEILRTVDGLLRTLPAELGTEILPGDVVYIPFPVVELPERDLPEIDIPKRDGASTD
ncbi:MAG: polysaccharide biosynthesis/export family protein [Ectothiorhodospiraceae bacterium]|nr:polysaccharide biosynthesis/export family protein [Ectothiorhodospiraceae bacterium]